MGNLMPWEGFGNRYSVIKDKWEVIGQMTSGRFMHEAVLVS